MSRVELAEKIGEPWWVIVDVEKDARRPTGDLLFALCRALGFPKAFFEQEPEPALPLGSLAYHGEWTEEEIEHF